MNSVVQQETRPARETFYLTPDVNIYETEDGYLLEAEMPGVTRNNIEITLEGNELTLVGRRNREQNHGEPLYIESRDAGYRRVFELDPTVDTARIAARMEQGVLTLTMPKAESVKPRRIEISE
jgi:HSP20 family protein